MSATLKSIGAAPDFYVKHDWSIARLWQVARLRSEKNRPDLPLLSVYLNRGVIQYSEGGGQVHKPGLDRTVYQVVHRGDFVLNNQQAWRGSVGVSRHEGIISPAYIVFSLASSLDPRFADFLFQSRDLVAQYLTASKGVGDIQRDIHNPWLKNVKIPIPPKNEQQEIVRYLDWAHGRLERAIRAKRKVIALLNEQKQAIIHRAVTGGLDSSVTLSENGSRFLESTPSHWELLRAKYVLQQVSPPIPADAEIVTCFRDGQVTLRRNRRTTGFTNAIWELGYQGIRPGQLVLHSMDAFAGAIGVSDSSGKCSPEYVICEPAMEGVSTEYYAFLLRSLALRGFFVALCPSVRERAPRVRFNDFGAFKLPKPPFMEQQAIVDSIYAACSGIDRSLARITREAELLKEYRTRLVADVVTGKLDVRETAARLPNEAEDDVSEVDESELDPADIDEEVLA